MNITLLAGGSGAAKFIDGLISIVPQKNLTIICNTGDDIELFGLHISPDVDTITYLFAGIFDEKRGWALKGDSFNGLKQLSKFGFPSWFNLGDKDIALHIYRSHLIRSGKTLSQATKIICEALGVKAHILPMSDEKVATMIHTGKTVLHFQEFFIREKWRVPVKSVRYNGAKNAKPAPGVLSAIRDADAVIICPSNPVTSISPILTVPGIREALKKTKAKRIAISPFTGKHAFSGPAGKLLRARGYESSSEGTRAFYGGILDYFVVDSGDAPFLKNTGAPRLVFTNILMRTLSQKSKLAREVLKFAEKQ